MKRKQVIQLIALEYLRDRLELGGPLPQVPAAAKALKNQKPVTPQEIHVIEDELKTQFTKKVIH